MFKYTHDRDNICHIDTCTFRPMHTTNIHEVTHMRETPDTRICNARTHHCALHALPSVNLNFKSKLKSDLRASTLINTRLAIESELSFDYYYISWKMCYYMCTTRFSILQFWKKNVLI